MRSTPSLVVLAGILGAFGIAFSWLWVLAVAGLALFFWTIWNRPMRWLRALGYGLLYGTLTGSAGIVWFLDAYPIARLGITNPFIGLVLVWSTWLFISLTLGSGVAVGTLLLRQLRTVPGRSIVTALAWALIEQARMWAFAGFTWAPQSLPGAQFSVASVGYALAAHPYLLQLAHPFGIFALDFVAALFAAAIAELLPWRPGALRTAAVGLCASLILLMLPMVTAYHPAPSTASLRFELIASDFPPEDTDLAGPIRELFARAVADPSAQVIVFPEGYGLTQAYPGEDILAQSRPLYGSRDLLLMTSSYTDEKLADGPPGVEALRYVSTQRGILAEYRKIFLVPVGEYEPLVFSAYYSLFDTPQFRHYLSYIGSRSRRGTDVVSFTYAGIKIGGLLCSDMIAPSLYRDLVYHQDAQVLVSLSNYSWFHTSPRLYDKMTEIAKVTAVENRRPLVVANNGAPTFVLDERGSFIAATPWHAVTVLPVTIPIRATSTP